MPGNLLPWGTFLISAEQAGTQLASFTTAASLTPATARYTIPPNWWAVGKSLVVAAQLSFGNVVTSAPTFTLEFRCGPTANIAVWSGGAMQTTTTAHTTERAWLYVLLTCRAVGASTSANLMGQGWLLSRPFQIGTAAADDATHLIPLLLPTGTAAVGTGFDSTVSNILDLYCACSVSNASNTAKLEQYTLQALN